MGNKDIRTSNTRTTLFTQVEYSDSTSTGNKDAWATVWTKYKIQNLPDIRAVKYMIYRYNECIYRTYIKGHRHRLEPFRLALSSITLIRYIVRKFEAKQRSVQNDN